MFFSRKEEEFLILIAFWGQVLAFCCEIWVEILKIEFLDAILYANLLAMKVFGIKIN